MHIARWRTSHDKSLQFLHLWFQHQNFVSCYNFSHLVLCKLSATNVCRGYHILSLSSAMYLFVWESYLSLVTCQVRFRTLLPHVRSLFLRLMRFPDFARNNSSSSHIVSNVIACMIRAFVIHSPIIWEPYLLHT